MISNSELFPCDVDSPECRISLDDLQVEQDELDFGKVFEGGTKKLPFKLANPSRADARVVIDMTEHPSFGLTLSKDDWDPDQYSEKPLQIMGKDSSINGSQSMSYVTQPFSNLVCHTNMHVLSC